MKGNWMGAKEYGTTLRRLVEMSIMAKKIKMGKCRYAYGREKADYSRRKTN
jgi:hypothetical protein